MPDVAVLQSLADGIHLQGNNTSGLGGNAPGGDGKDEKDKKVLWLENYGLPFVDARLL